jgi:hypothetical protein
MLVVETPETLGATDEAVAFWATAGRDAFGSDGEAALSPLIERTDMQQSLPFGTELLVVTVTASVLAPIAPGDGAVHSSKSAWCDPLTNVDALRLVQTRAGLLETVETLSLIVPLYRNTARTSRSPAETAAARVRAAGVDVE